MGSKKDGGSTRIPSLDGLRAASIGLVILSHGMETRGFPHWASFAAFHAGQLGTLGVDVFFVVSGFLITLLLFREQERRGSISLRGFYARRVLRISPAYLCYLACAFALTRLGYSTLRRGDWLAALTYTMNFLPDLNARWLVGHTWSLSVEEHFYLLWPPVLALLGRRRALPVLLLAIGTAPLWRWFAWGHLRGLLDVDFATPARMDTIAIGCLLAYGATGSAAWRDRIAAVRRSPTLAFALAWVGIAASMFVLSRSGKYALLLNRPVVALLIAVSIAAVSAPGDSGSVITRVLNWRPLVLIGVLSYSLYLWQQPFMNPHSDWWIAAFPQNLGLCLACAIGSHVLIERPFLRLKDRLGSRRHGPVESPSPGIVGRVGAFARRLRWRVFSGPVYCPICGRRVVEPKPLMPACPEHENEWVSRSAF